MRYDKLKPSPSIRLLLRWRNKIINFGTFDFKKDGSLLYSSAFHSDVKRYSTVTIGTFSDGAERPSGTITNEPGIHLSLHPRDQILHIRKPHPKEILCSKRMQWFPVRKEFLLARVISPPLDECAVSAKEKDFVISIPDEYVDSVEMCAWILPWSESVQINSDDSSRSVDSVLGYHRGHYWVMCNFIMTNVRSAAAILYPV